MRIFEGSLHFRLVADGRAEALSRPELVASYMADAFERHPFNEAFWVITLNRRNYPSGRTLVSLGTLTGALVHPREVFRAAVLASASAIIVTHNHPGGDPAPSGSDLKVTRRLSEAASVMDIELLDHVIVGQPDCDPAGRGYYSFRDAHLL